MNNLEITSNIKQGYFTRIIEKGKRKLRIIKTEIGFYKTKLKKIQKLRKLKKNFNTLDRCMINPKNIKIGSLEKCTYSNLSIMRYRDDYDFSGYIIEQYEPIQGEKVLIELSQYSDTYIDLEQINTNEDLHEIRDQITTNGIIVEGKILGSKGRNNININQELLNQCNSGKIVVNRNLLHEHPYFKNTSEPLSIKQLKKIIEEQQ